MSTSLYTDTDRFNVRDAAKALHSWPAFSSWRHSCSGNIPLLLSSMIGYYLSANPTLFLIKLLPFSPLEIATASGWGFQLLAVCFRGRAAWGRRFCYGRPPRGWPSAPWLTLAEAAAAAAAGSSRCRGSPSRERSSPSTMPRTSRRPLWFLGSRSAALVLTATLVWGVNFRFTDKVWGEPVDCGAAGREQWMGGRGVLPSQPIQWRLDRCVLSCEFQVTANSIGVWLIDAPLQRKGTHSIWCFLFGHCQCCNLWAWE